MYEPVLTIRAARLASRVGQNTSGKLPLEHETESNSTAWISLIIIGYKNPYFYKGFFYLIVILIIYQT